MLSEECKVKLKNMMYKAIELAEEHLEDDAEEAHWYVEIATDIDHICRKHYELEQHNS